jgi:hypothetical protein
MPTSTPRVSDMVRVWFDAEAELELLEWEPIQKLHLADLTQDELILSTLV